MLVFRDCEHFFLSQAAHPYAIFERYHVSQEQYSFARPTYRAT